MHSPTANNENEVTSTQSSVNNMPKADDLKPAAAETASACGGDPTDKFIKLEGIDNQESKKYTSVATSKSPNPVTTIIRSNTVAAPYLGYLLSEEETQKINKENHGNSPFAAHTSDMDLNKTHENTENGAPVHSTTMRMRVNSLLPDTGQIFSEEPPEDYGPLTGMEQSVRHQAVDGDLTVPGVEKDWPEAHGISHSDKKTGTLFTINDINAFISMISCRLETKPSI